MYPNNSQNPFFPNTLYIDPFQMHTLDSNFANYAPLNNDIFSFGSQSNNTNGYSNIALTEFTVPNDLCDKVISLLKRDLKK